MLAPIVIPTLLFLALLPGVLVTLPPASGSASDILTLGSASPSVAAAHSILFLVVLYLISNFTGLMYMF